MNIRFNENDHAERHRPKCSSRVKLSSQQPLPKASSEARRQSNTTNHGPVFNSYSVPTIETSAAIRTREINALLQQAFKHGGIHRSRTESQKKAVTTFSVVSMIACPCLTHTRRERHIPKLNWKKEKGEKAESKDDVDRGRQAGR